MTKQAVYAVEIDTEKKIHLFSFGAVEGIDDILAQLENIDEMFAPDTVFLENSDITTFLLLGSIDHHKQAKDIDSGYYWSNSYFLDHVQRFKPDPGFNIQESFLTYSGIGK